MKKLFFIALFTLGLFSLSNAQTFLTYSVENSGSDIWQLGMADGGTSPAQYELDILPNDVRTGVFINYAFPFEFKCENSNGCGTYQFVPTVTNGVYVPITNCGTPTALKYRLEVVIPFVLWEFEMKFG